MSTQNKVSITVENIINAPVEKVWEYWTKPEHITQWNNESDDWHTPHAENDFRPGGKFVFRMEAKDGSAGFDFGGVNDVITPHEYIEYTLGDGRKVKIYFKADGDKTKVKETFEAEDTNSIDVQQGGWQAILNNFKKYTEGK
ncbi:MAG TPA: SRPBCC family protein [Chitinophagaceae bacterium]|nr:SRPBCC family protein [Chitinophagaceae bacterium]